MKNIKKSKRKSLRRSLSLIILGVILYGIIIQHIRLGHYELIAVLLVASWLMLYIHHVELRIKDEILEELKKEKNDKSNKKD